MLFYRGKLDAKRVTTYQGKTRVQLQFIEQRSDGSFNLMEIKVPDDVDHSRFLQGKEVEFPVACSVVDGTAYFRVLNPKVHE